MLADNGAGETGPGREIAMVNGICSCIFNWTPGDKIDFYLHRVYIVDKGLWQ